MKYASLVSTRDKNVNIGDYLQFVAVWSLMERAGISSSEIVPLMADDVVTYRGEHLVLPLSFGIFPNWVIDGKITISDDITPIFLSFALGATTMDGEKLLLNQENVEFFKKWAPIGARDLYSYRLYKKYNIPAYFPGCHTITLPENKSNVKGTGVIFVDVPYGLKRYIPSDICNNATIYSQLCHIEDTKNFREIFEFVKTRYELYQQAALVVTSRLHVALPLASFGVPTILARDFFDTRFSFVDQIIPAYDANMFNSIDWNPAPAHLDSLKREIAELALLRIKEPNSDFRARNFYKDDGKEYINASKGMHKYPGRLNQWIKENHYDKKPFDYILWGAGEAAFFYADYIRDNYPNLSLVSVADRFKSGNFQGIPICEPDSLSAMTDALIIVTAVSAGPDALRLANELGIEESKICFAVERFIDKV